MSTPSTIPAAEHDAEPLTEARIAATLDRLSRLEQACAAMGDDTGMGHLYLLTGSVFALLLIGVVLLRMGVL